MFELHVPWPISVNNYYRSGANNRRYLPKVVEDYRMQVFVLFKNSKLPKFEDDDDLVMHVTLHPPNKRKFDIDNGLKCLLDALEHAGVYGNDNQISKLIVDRRRSCTDEVLVRIDKRQIPTKPWQCL